MRNQSFDIVRGYAALFVVISHLGIVGFRTNEDIWMVMEWAPLRIFWSGHQAVILFFVLSGYSLTFLVNKSANFSFIKYAMSRTFRLLMPCLFSVLMIFIIYEILKIAGYNWSEEFYGRPSSSLDIYYLCEKIMSLDIKGVVEINPPLWSLIYEMIISLIIPFFITYKRKFRINEPYSILYILILDITVVCYYFFLDAYSILFHTFHYTLIFLIGVWLFYNESILKDKANNYGFLIIGLFLYAYPFKNEWSDFSRMLGDIVISIGSVLVLINSSLIRSNLYIQCGRFLARVSFSLYVTHYLIITTVLVLMPEISLFIWHWMLIILLSLCVSYVFDRYIDVPIVKFARKLR